MEIQSAKTTPDTPPPPLIPPFISRAADRTEHFRLSFSISPPLLSRKGARFIDRLLRDLDHVGDPLFGRGRRVGCMQPRPKAKRKPGHGRVFYSTDLTRPPRRRTVLITNLPRQERLICRGELNGVFSRAFRRVPALKIGGGERPKPV